MKPVQSASLIVQARNLSDGIPNSGSSSENKEPDPPPANLCCMSGCANCVWLDYADDMIKYYERKGETLKVEEILDLVDQNVDDEMIKAFVKMEIKSKFVFNNS